MKIDKAGRAARWREALPFVGAATLLAAGIVTLAAADLWRSRQAALAEGGRAAAGLAHVLAEQTARTVQAVDLTLRGIVQVLELVPDEPKHSPDLEASMRAQLADLPYVRALFVIGPDGRLTQDTNRDTPDVSLADRPYFQAHRDAAGLGLHIGHPLVSRRSTGTWFVSFSRRITRPDGRFGGVAVAAVEPRYFTRFYGGIDVGRDGALNLLLRDGTLIARSPSEAAAIGRSFADDDLFRRLLPARSTGTSQGASPVDGRRRVTSYRTVEGLPLVVLVGLSEAALLEQWRARAVTVGVAAAGLVALVAALAALLVERRRRRRDARARLARAERLEALGQLMGGVAHDFGNLLTVVAVNLAMIRRAQGHAECAQQAEMAERAVRRGTQLIGQLLAFARRQDLRPETVSPNDLITAFEGLLRQAAGREVALETRLDPGLPRCHLDSGQFEAALLNLVVNARDATPAGGRISVSTERVRVDEPAAPPRGGLRPGVYADVAVRDTGAGMPPAVLERVLEPFFTTKPADKGTGLGLSQVYGFATQSGGHLAIESAPGAGTTVHLYFPEATGEVTARPRAASDDVAA